MRDQNEWLDEGAVVVATAMSGFGAMLLALFGGAVGLLWCFWPWPLP